jgi:hypothetical protein
MQQEHAGQVRKFVLLMSVVLFCWLQDKIVPGYYHRRQEDGEMCHSTCCNSEYRFLAGTKCCC